jgi:hypothetical protein
MSLLKSSSKQLLKSLAAEVTALSELGYPGQTLIKTSEQIKDLEQRVAFLRERGKIVRHVLLRYDQMPVGPREFLESPQYMNMPGNLWELNMVEYEQANSGMFDQMVLTGGIGTGKTTVAIATQLYQLYLALITKSLHEMFDLIPTDEIVFVFQSLNSKLAKGVDYERFKALVEKGPFFRGKYDFDRSLSSEMKFGKRIIVRPVSGSDTAVIGQNVIGGIMDEVNFMSVVEDSKRAAKASESGVYDQALQNYRAIMRRRESRFGAVQAKLPGILCLVSSRQYPGEFTDQRIKEAEDEIARTGRTKIYVYDKRRWEVRPDLFKNGQWFNVFIGDETRKPRIMLENEEIPHEQKHLVLKVPEFYRNTFETDLLAALRDVGGVATMALHPFMPQREAISACFGRTKNVLSREDCDFVATKPALNKKAIQYPQMPRFVHVDLAFTSDSAGVACGFVPEFVTVKRGEDVETLPVIQYDFTLEVRPPKGGEILVSNIRQLLYNLRANGVPIRWVTFDSYQSRDALQILAQKGFITGMVSMDVDLKPYGTLKTALIDQRVKTHEHHEALQELLTLEIDAKKRKIDHPPGGSKDIADAMAGVAHGLTMRRQIWRMHKVIGQLPKSISGSKDIFEKEQAA